MYMVQNNNHGMRGWEQSSRTLYFGRNVYTTLGTVFYIQYTKAYEKIMKYTILRVHKSLQKIYEVDFSKSTHRLSGNIGND